MRIISGSLKGRLITVPSKFKLRPTTDLAKESLFNILNNMISFEDTNALDLFAGTGSISYELASRGCRNVVSVEKDHRHCDFIRKSAETLKISNIDIIKSDVFEFIQKSYGNYDIIFADPPYDLKGVDTIPKNIFEKKLLRNDGLLIVEHSDAIDFSSMNEFSFIRRYGAVHFSFFQLENDTE